jgi:TatD DNase family protein
MIIDTHSHCYWDSLLPRIDTIRSNMQEKGIIHAVQIGCDIISSEQAIDLAIRFPQDFSATIGLHPESAQHILFDSEEAHVIRSGFARLLDTHRSSIVAVGETGLDYHYLDPDVVHHDQQKQNQYQWLEYQWNLARAYDLPLVIHTRDAREDTILSLKKYNITRAVMHCFSEDYVFASELLDFSSEIYFSFSGILTYKNAQAIQDAASKIPLDRILIETDAPFLSPQSVR